MNGVEYSQPEWFRRMQANLWMDFLYLPLVQRVSFATPHHNWQGLVR